VKPWLNACWKVFLAFTLAITLLSGCTGKTVAESYPLESVVRDGPQVSYVYRAANEPVPAVAEKLAEERKPEQMSNQNPEHMFLVYSDEWYHVQQDPKKPTDTLIEVDSKEFVQRNYNPSFLEGYIFASIVNNLFGQRSTPYYGDYRGYSYRDVYRPATSYHPPTSEEKKVIPPITSKGVGSIIKRGQTGTNNQSGTPIVPPVSPSTNQPGKIIKNPSGGSYSNPQPQSGTRFNTPPKSTSPPKTNFGGFGRLKRRR
jgi:hypothetical protein